MSVVGSNSFPLRYRYSEGLITGYRYCFVPEYSNAERIASGWTPAAKYIFEVYRWCEDQFGERGYRWGETEGGSANGHAKIILLVEEADAFAFRMRWC